MDLIAHSIRKKSPLFILFLIFIVAELIAWPIGEFPLNDDWAYTWSVKKLFQQGELQIGAWPAMTLWSHLIWGLLFLKLFGFSFFILRFSTLVACCITLWLLYKLVKIKTDSTTALLTAITLLVCPIYFNLSNTYMTDITFLMLSLSAIYAATKFFESGNFLHFWLVYVFSILLVLVRQYGIALPIAFSLACMYRRIPLRVSAVWLSLVGLAITIGVLKYYESYLKLTLPASSTYKFSSDISVFDQKFYTYFLNNLQDRSKWMVMYVLTFASPMCLFILPGLMRKYPLKYSIPVVVITTAVGMVLFAKIPFPMGNILQNMNLGTDTFYESLSLDPAYSHNFSASFKKWAIIICSFLSGTSLSALILSMPNLRNKLIVARPLNVLLFSLLLFYTLLLCITESFFDRYLLLPLVLFMILLAQPGGIGKSSAPAFLLLLGLFLFSTLGTRDYFVLNRLKWDIRNQTIQHYQLPDYLVNGGFEINSWDSGRYNHWMSFLKYKQYHYLIQYSQAPGFTPVASYPFKRLLGNKMDTLKVFRNDSLVHP